MDKNSEETFAAKLRALNTEELSQLSSSYATDVESGTSQSYLQFMTELIDRVLEERGESVVSEDNLDLGLSL